MSRKEYQAVFTGPDGRTGSRGEARSSIKQALQDTPVDGMESSEELTGVEVREVTPWAPVALSEIIKASEGRSP